ncbi:MAG TPA: hypothetical protein VFL47_02085 [Flavisolibacter sp.]|nr:hypothetical protein [Flavisolibacter sp.]
MNTKKKRLWIGLSLFNLSIVALFGFILRSKILFPLEWVDYRSLLSAHSHFAFGGWVGLCLLTLLVYDVLPATLSQKPFYQWMLAGIDVSSLGMALFFPFEGYGTIAIFFSSLYIVVTYVFAPVFLRDVVNTVQEKTIRWLAVGATLSLLVSAIGPLGLVYILVSGSTNSLLYRDSIYTFLHFQYNGFFTLGVFALFFQFLIRKGVTFSSQMNRFVRLLCLSVLPALFLSLLWHGKALHYSIAAVGAFFIVAALGQFIPFFVQLRKEKLFTSTLAQTFWLFAFLSFLLKMVLNVGTLIPSLGHAVFGNRPVIIGFLHLVFLGFVTFFFLSRFLEEGLFIKDGRSARLPFYLFASGIIANEAVLALQGLGILFKTNSGIYTWLLWIASILLLAGASSITFAYWRTKKAAGPAFPSSESAAPQPH